METTKTNDNPSIVPIPDYELLPDLSLKDAVTKRNYLLDFPKPKYGWTSGIGSNIERSITSLNETIADCVSGRKPKNERK